MNFFCQEHIETIVVHIIVFHNKSKRYNGIHFQIVHAHYYRLEGHKGSLKHTKNVFYAPYRVSRPSLVASKGQAGLRGGAGGGVKSLLRVF
jgi:hypothetical protein